MITQRLVIAGSLTLCFAMSNLAQARPIPDMYDRIAARHGIPPLTVYRAAITASGRPSRYSKTLMPWPWTIKICEKKRCDRFFLKSRAEMENTLASLQGIAWITLYVGPLGLQWDAANDLPLRAATQPRVTVNAAVKLMRDQSINSLSKRHDTSASLTTKTVGKISKSRAHRKYHPLIAELAKEAGVDAKLIHAVIKVESAYQADAISSAGAVGMMQLMPSTGERFGIKSTERTNPEKNIRAGIKYLKFLNHTFKGNLDLVLAGYNAGEGAVMKYGGKIPPYKETQEYVKKVKTAYKKLGGML